MHINKKIYVKVMNMNRYILYSRTLDMIKLPKLSNLLFKLLKDILYRYTYTQIRMYEQYVHTFTYQHM